MTIVTDSTKKPTKLLGEGGGTGGTYVFTPNLLDLLAARPGEGKALFLSEQFPMYPSVAH